jgi:hypothetical protein
MNNSDFKCVLTQAVLTGVVVYLLLAVIISPVSIGLPKDEKLNSVAMSISLYAALAALLGGWVTSLIQPSCPQKSTLF